jgi:Calx-beta domain-containing protein
MEARMRQAFGRMTILAVALLACTGRTDAAVVIEGARQPWLRIGADGLGIVAYRAGATNDLEVAHCMDAACSAVTTAVVDSAGDVGYRATMVIAPNGRPVISYLDVTNGDLKVAFCADPVCATASMVVLDPDVGISSQPDAGRTAIAVGADGLVLVAYTDMEPGVPPPPHFVNDRLKIVHCDDAACATRTTTNVMDAVGYLPVVMGIAGDGRAFFQWHRVAGLSTFLASARCSDLACTRLAGLTEAAQRTPILPSAFTGYPSLAFQENGGPAWLYTVDLPGIDSGLKYVRCESASCGAPSVETMEELGGVTSLSLPGAGALPRFAANGSSGSGSQLALHRCQDAGCAVREVSCIAAEAFQPSLATDPTGRDVIAFTRGDHVEIRRLEVPGPATCSVEAWVVDSDATERDPGQPVSAVYFPVTVAPASAVPVTVAYQTVDGTALAGSDYVAQSGVLTIAPGQAAQAIVVPVVADGVSEPTETFSLQLSTATGATIVDGTAVAVITDDDGPPPLPTVDLGGCTVSEGDTSAATCLFELALSQASTQAVTVDFASQDGTATAGSDYFPGSGTFTFPPGIVSGAIAFAVIGDTDVELDEAFTLVLSNPVNAQAGTMAAAGAIVDDDAPPLSTLEVSHGTRLLADLAGAPDVYRLAQAPYTSWEAVIDGVSGDIAPGLVLERLAEDNSTVLQTAVPAGTGSVRALRWQHRGSTPEVRQHLRVRSTDCGTACGPDDVYRLRVYETTGSIARFSNFAPQATVVLLQNVGDTTTSVRLDFWSPSGALLLSHPAALAPFQMVALDTSTLPALAGISGSVTVTHDGAYGALAGKSASLDPVNAFAFDTPLVYKPR